MCFVGGKNSSTTTYWWRF